MSDNKILDLDALMDTEMGSVETLPDYVTPSKGIYVLKVVDAGTKERKAKDGTKTTGLNITYAIVETKESEEAPFPNGSMFNDRFTATEDGLVYFKKRAMQILNVPDLDGVKLRDVFDGLKEAEPFNCAITIRKTKAEDGKEYDNINVRPLHEAPKG